MALNPSVIRALFSKLTPHSFDGIEVSRAMHRIINKVDPNSLPVKNAGNVLKRAISFNPTIVPNSLIYLDPIAKHDRSNFWQFYSSALPLKKLSDMPESTTALGDNVFRELLTRSDIHPMPGSVSVPELPLSELVVNGTQVVPHANTALGRWYRRVKNNPRFTTVYEEPIGPRPRWEDWDLPF